MIKTKSFENLKKVLFPIFENIGAIVSVALNHPADVRHGEVLPVEPEEIKTDFRGEVVYGKMKFTEGLSDQVEFLATPDHAGAWAEMMVMGDGTAEFSAEKHLDGVGELLNQLAGVICQSLSRLLGSPVKHDPIEAVLKKVETRLKAWQSFFRLDIFFEVEDLGESKLTMLLSPQVAEELSKIQISEEDLTEDRPPPAVLDAGLESSPSAEVRAARFEDFGAKEGGSGPPQNIEALMDVELQVTIELGRTSMFIRDILELSPGSIVELNKLSGEPVDLFINDKKFARGEVVVIDENFGIRVTELVKVEDRIKSLK